MTNDWPHVRARIIDAFDGELPGGPLEQACIDLYEANPTAIINAIESVAASLRNGKINSGWAVLKTAAAKKVTQQSNPTVSREKLIRNADQWLRNAGCMYDRWSEVRDELFGDRGRLRTIHTPKLEQRYHDAWVSIRPAGEQVEVEEIERDEHWKARRGALAQLVKTTDPAELRRRALILGAVEPDLPHPEPKAVA